MRIKRNEGIPKEVGQNKVEAKNANRSAFSASARPFALQSMYLRVCLVKYTRIANKDANEASERH